MELFMATITFDTLKFANKLKSAGVPPEHAEAEAEALADIFEINLNPYLTHAINIHLKTICCVLKNLRVALHLEK
jgi:hypothetical protein